MTDRYRCFECKNDFFIGDQEEYHDDPATRKCVLCNGGEGNIGYLGYIGSLPSVRSDGMSDTFNPADGKTYDSKSAYYKGVAAAGCNIVEDNPLERKRKDHGNYDNTKELKQAIEQVTKGRGL